jgi:hypothetical protein
MKKPEVKTVDFDAEKVETLLSIALQLANSSAHAGIKEATNRLLAKVEQGLEEKLEKVHEEEAKEAAAPPQPVDDQKGGKK